jgi:purine-binding chemotaxis protein CheW
MLNDKGGTNIKQVVTFSVDVEEYGIEILKVQEVIRLPQITKLPKAPQFIKGIIDLRGVVIPIVDLREKFGLVAKEYKENTRVIIIEVEEKKIGMIVDNVSQVVSTPESSILPPPPSMYKSDSEKYIDGVIRLEERFIILLNINHIFSTEEVVQLEQTDFSMAETL